MTDAYIVNTIIQGAYYFTGLENLDFIDGALDDILELPRATSPTAVH